MMQPLTTMGVIRVSNLGFQGKSQGQARLQLAFAASVPGDIYPREHMMQQLPIAGSQPAISRPSFAVGYTTSFLSYSPSQLP